MSKKSLSSSNSATGFQLREVAESDSESKSISKPASATDFEDLGDLPRSYESDVIFLVAQEPHWLFCYWDLDISKHPGGAAFLRCYLGSGELEQEIEVPFETRNWYLPAQKADSDYIVEMGHYSDGEWLPIARSNPTHTPSEGVSRSADFEFATVPFHLSFQRLVDRIDSALQSGDALVSALARLQQAGDFGAFGGLDVPPALDPAHRALLEALLGRSFLEELSSPGLGASEIEAKIRAHLDERLSSGGASDFIGQLREVLSSESMPASMGVSSFGLEKLNLASGALASWDQGPIASWAAGVISSWSNVPASSWSEAGASSFQAAGGSSEIQTPGWSRAIATSWAKAAVGSWLGGAPSSAGLTSWPGGETHLASWLTSAQTSWLTAVLSSWNEAALSSWAGPAGQSSWGGSEAISSFANANREFFMHVNAEVIFYGGTHPDAEVTVNGEKIQLSPDGNFRFHFVLPDGDFEIPIRAVSPDGIETRSATLRFKRSTARSGEVTDTPQPPLGEPMGRIAPAGR